MEEFSFKNDPQFMGRSIRYEAYLVKFDTPGSIILDLVLRKNMSEELEETRKSVEKINSLWMDNENDTVDGKRYLTGETVAVKVKSSWKPGLVLDFKLVNYLHHYDVLHLDTGQITREHRMNLRDAPVSIMPPCRYVLFTLMNLLPVDSKISIIEPWDIDASHDMEFLLNTASRILVEVKAVKRRMYSQQFFGNMYLDFNNEILDIREWLLKKNVAYEDKKKFDYAYCLKDEDYLLCKDFEKKEEIGMKPQRSIENNPPVKMKYITDEALDAYLPKPLRIGSTDPLPQSERETVRAKLMKEACVTFNQPTSNNDMGSIEVVAKTKTKPSRYFCENGALDSDVACDRGIGKTDPQPQAGRYPVQHKVMKGTGEIYYPHTSSNNEDNGATEEITKTKPSRYFLENGALASDAAHNGGMRRNDPYPEAGRDPIYHKLKNGVGKTFHPSNNDTGAEAIAKTKPSRYSLEEDIETESYTKDTPSDTASGYNFQSRDSRKSLSNILESVAINGEEKCKYNSKVPDTKVPDLVPDPFLNNNHKDILTEKFLSLFK